MNKFDETIKAGRFIYIFGEHHHEIVNQALFTLSQRKAGNFTHNEAEAIEAKLSLYGLNLAVEPLELSAIKGTTVQNIVAISFQHFRKISLLKVVYGSRLGTLIAIDFITGYGTYGFKRA